jgi:hypothetical protein
MQENRQDIQVREAKSSKEEWLEEARRLEGQNKFEQAEQIRAKYLGYEYISREQLEVIKSPALDPAKKEAEVKKERKQLFQYAVNHRRYDWVETLAQLQFQRAMLYMKELRADRKEYEKHLRLGNKSRIGSIVQKYGVDFTTGEGATGLMHALYHAQAGVATDLLKQGASLVHTDKEGRIAIDYLLKGYLEIHSRKQAHPDGKKMFIEYWSRVRPQTQVYECDKRLFRIDSHNMLFFLLVLLRNTVDNQPRRYTFHDDPSEPKKAHGAFNMDNLERFAALMPDEVLPPYRKRRTYINSIMALHEINRDSPYCKKAFIRAERGWYILNPEIIMENTLPEEEPTGKKP